MGKTFERFRARRDWLLAAVMVCAVTAAYAPALKAGYVWDDDEYVSQNPNLNDSAGLRRIWLEPRTSPQYYPLVFTSFWLERRLGGAARLSHAINIALHLANALLLWTALRRLRITAAYAVALLFAVHPVGVESVAWITERKNVLSTFFYLLTLCAYIRGSSTHDAAGLFERRQRGWRYALVVLWFAAALLSKSTAATLPAVILAAIWWARGSVSRNHLVSLAPLCVLGAAAGLTTAWLEIHNVGATGTDWDLSLGERVLVAGRVLWFYAWKICWPHPIVFNYPRWTPDVSDVGQWAFPAAAAAVAAGLWIRRAQWGRGPFALLVCFVATLLPVLGVVSVYPMRYSFVADHFQYVAGIAVIVAVCVAAASLLRRFARSAPAAALAIATIACATIARAETAKYDSAEALWQDTLRKNPASWLANNDLGIIQLSQGRLAEARSSFERAISARSDIAEAHTNLGTVLFRSGHPDLAAASHRQALALNPAYAEAHNNLAVALSALGRDDEAFAALQQAVTLDPDYPTAHYNLGNALARRGRYADAEAEYLTALKRAPDMTMAHYRLGLTRVDLGRFEEAAASFEAAFRLDPSFSDGFYQAGNVLLRGGQPQLAEGYYRRALGVKPDWAEAHCNLGTALMKRGQLNEAAAEYRRALELKPGYLLAERNLAITLDQLERNRR